MTSAAKTKHKPRVVAEYDYRDERGHLLYQSVRFDPKDFRQRQPDGSGGWDWNLRGVRRVLYGLPELYQAPRDRLVFVCEGEKDVENLRKVGLLATTNAMGAGKWCNDYTETLRGRHVVILPDNDDPGREHARAVAIALKGVAASVKVVQLPGLPDKGDVSDWLLIDGNDKTELLKLVQAAPDWEEPPDADPQAGAAPAGGDGASEGRPGVQIIQEYFRQRYGPVFKRGNAICCADGQEVPMTVACAVPDSKVIAQLSEASDRPEYKGGEVNYGALPGFFTKWARVAWGDLLGEPKDEDGVNLGKGAPAGEEFRRLVRQALLQEIVFGDVIGRTGVTQTERRSLIGWCEKWAKPGPWRSIRSKKCWTKLEVLPNGEVRLKVALRVDLFAQVNADARLRGMPPNTFARRAERYGIGRTGGKQDRPHGVNAVILDDEFVADLTAGMADD